MPLEKIVTEQGRGWARWKIEESEETLRQILMYPEAVPGTISHAQKRLEWLAGRVLTHMLVQEMNLQYQGIVKDEYGKPLLNGCAHGISLSHSYPYVAAILDERHDVGIDLEQPKQKLLRVAPRVLSTRELQDAGTDLIKHCIYWCAKEAMIKVYGKKDLVLAENLLVEPFIRQEEGNIIGKLIVKSRERIIPLYYQVTSQFVMAFNTYSS